MADEKKVTAAQILMRLEGLEIATREFLRHARTVKYADSTGKRLTDSAEYQDLAVQSQKVDDARWGGHPLPLTAALRD